MYKTFVQIVCIIYRKQNALPTAHNYAHGGNSPGLPKHNTRSLYEGLQQPPDGHRALCQFHVHRFHRPLVSKSGLGKYCSGESV